MINEGNTIYKKLITSILNKMPAINKWRHNFLVETFTLFLSIKGRINFLQLERHGKYKEQSCRQQFEKPFDFLSFNLELIKEHGSGSYVIAIDPTFIPKSGKKTPGLSKFWSGQASQAKEGLEIVGIAAIDMKNNTAFHLEASQTIPTQGKTLVDTYVNVLIERSKKILSLTKVVVADAYFSKKAFISPLLEHGFTVICRLRKDADLLYLNNQKLTGKRGRPKKFDGKVDHKEINTDYFDTIQTVTQAETYYTAVVYSKSLKRNIRIVIVKKNEGSKATSRIYFSTDTEISAELIIQYYKSRFQIEFLYRDAKQHTGLNHCQARSENKLKFHFNASLTTLNLAKATGWLKKPISDRDPFSMSDIKTMNHNALLMEQFLSKFAIDPNLTENQNYIHELIYFGTIAA